jgi:gluconokinase
MKNALVVMGVAGCGKSSLGAAIAQAAGLQLVEGDDHHSSASKSKMRAGIALDDTDREGWLQTLHAQLQMQSPAMGVVLTCSALKRAYRDRLRAGALGLGFVYMHISREQALVRVTARADTHFFSTSLVDSQFATLEVPCNEADVLQVDALAPMAQLQAQVLAWAFSKERR